MTTWKTICDADELVVIRGFGFNPAKRGENERPSSRKSARQSAPSPISWQIPSRIL
jgi:hypothetical protein